jgi:hypothetical protein
MRVISANESQVNQNQPQMNANEREWMNQLIEQTLNYLRASNHHIALLVNFQHPKVEWRRVVYNF